MPTSVLSTIFHCIQCTDWFYVELHPLNNLGQNMVLIFGAQSNIIWKKKIWGFLLGSFQLVTLSLHNINTMVLAKADKIL